MKKAISKSSAKILAMAKKMSGRMSDDSDVLKSYSRRENGKSIYSMPEGNYKPSKGRYYLSHDTPKSEIHG